ncbi:MAG TPA: ATP-binding protein, partial [Blastocatellia bacterium]|nr:ATP-binding protein [Blastocatellia bacterium]
MKPVDTQQELLEGIMQIITLAEGERKLLAADLHDQTLTDLRELSRLARRLYEESDERIPADVREGLGQITTGLEAAMDEVRRAMESLSPSALDTLGLLPAIEGRLARAPARAARPFSTRFICRVAEDEIALTDIERLLVYRIVQEALNNTSKHSEARLCELVVTLEGRELLIRVTDDGRGMSESIDESVSRGLT